MPLPLRCAVVAIVAVLLRVPPVGAQTGCALRNHQPVVLASAGIDPDVFVWDSRLRLASYAYGQIDDARSVLDHTLLAKPGTRAVVMSCERGAIHEKYTTNVYDAVHIKLMTGPNKGRFGWVASEDVHVPRS